MTVFNFSYAIDTLNKGANTVTVIYFPEDTTLGNFLEIISFDPQVHNTPALLEELIVSRAPTFKWITATKNAKIDLSALDSLLSAGKIDGKSIDIDIDIIDNVSSVDGQSLEKYKRVKIEQVDFSEQDANRQPVSHAGIDYPVNTLNYVAALTSTLPWSNKPVWVTTNSNRVTLTKEDVQTILNNIVTRIADNSIISTDVKSKIEFADTKEAVDQISLDVFK